MRVLKLPRTLPGPRQLQDLLFWCFSIRNREDCTWSPVPGLVPQIWFLFIASSRARFKPLCSLGSAEVPWVVSWVLCWSKVCVWCKSPRRGPLTHQQIKSCFRIVPLLLSLLTSVVGGGRATLIGQQSSFIALHTNETCCVTLWQEPPSWMSPGHDWEHVPLVQTGGNTFQNHHYRDK